MSIKEKWNHTRCNMIMFPLGALSQQQLQDGKKAHSKIRWSSLQLVPILSGGCHGGIGNVVLSDRLVLHPNQMEELPELVLAKARQSSPIKSAYHNSIQVFWWLDSGLYFILGRSDNTYLRLGNYTHWINNPFVTKGYCCCVPHLNI